MALSTTQAWMRIPGLKLSPFCYLNIAQFLGALNDNLFRYFVIFLLIGNRSAQDAYGVVATATAVFVIPFLLFSGAAGILADRYSKSRITVATKLLEVVLASIGIVAFALNSAWASYLVLFLLAAQSALFGPAKYGIVPELVKTEELSKANGMVTSFTYSAAIAGTVFASVFTTLTDRSFVICGFICLAVSLLGLWASWMIPYTHPSGAKKKISLFFIRDIRKTLFEARETPLLPTVILGSAFFLFIAAIIQMNVVPFAMQSLGLADVAGGYLFSAVTIGIGIGAVLAGRISGREVQLGLAVIGAGGFTVLLLALGVLPPTVWGSVIVLLLLGMFGGFYQIPLDSYIQYAAHPQRRGQAVAAGSFLSFAGVALSAGFFALLGQGLALTPPQVFFVVSGITLLVTIGLARQVPDRLVHTISRALYIPFLNINSQGDRNFSLQATEPRLLVMKGMRWKDVFLLAGFAQSYRFYLPISILPARWLLPVFIRFGAVLYEEQELESVHSDLASDILDRAPAGQPLCLILPPDRRYPMLEQMLPSAFPIVEVTIERPEKRAIQLVTYEL